MNTTGTFSDCINIPCGASLEELEMVARAVRHRIVRMSHIARAPHLGSALSCVDILVAAYWRALRIDPAYPDAPDRDRLLLSKGHAAAALYAVLAARGFFPEAWLDTYAKTGAKLPEQPGPGCAPGVELATGSLGHGLPVGVGLALGARMTGSPYRTFVVIGDGECNEGSVWEAALFAPAHRLGRLVTIVDYNRWQATGRSDEVLALPDLASKWRAFGWEAHEVDGHDLGALAELLSADFPAEGAPTAIIAHTTKGRGVSFMEDNNNWHYRIPNAAEVAQAAEELDIA